MQDFPTSPPPCLVTLSVSCPALWPCSSTFKTFYNENTKQLSEQDIPWHPYSPKVPLYFLLGQLPIEAVHHNDVLTLFWCIWDNPQTKIHDILKYLLMMSNSKSLTWSAHVRILFKIYGLPDPLRLLSGQAWPKDTWIQTVTAKVAAHHEGIWRSKAVVN